jgi:MoaA/NifB/PqqE/SkfB family radical SAM enzyme
VACNLNCPHCLDDKTVLALRAPERRRIAGLLANSGVMGVDVSGGEPLLLADLVGLLTILRAGDLVLSVTTNGWRLAELAKRLVDHVDAVRVSLDGATPSTHDRWRGSGSFERAIAGMSAAVRAGIPLQVQTVLMRDTAGDLDDIASLAASHGARGVTVLQMLPIGEGRMLAPEQALSDLEAQRLADVVAARAVIPVRLRRRDSAEGFTVVRADGRVWQNGPGAASIVAIREFDRSEDLLLTDRDGSA